MVDHNFKKKFGQNFLTSNYWPQKLVEAAQIVAGDFVIEIGPGDGSVTKELLAKGAKVTAIEIDEELLPGLDNKFGDFDSFRLVNQDILKLNIDEITEGNKYKVVGSLPYNISKPIISLFLKHQKPPQLMALIVQHEVAQDYTTVTPNNSFLNMFAYLYSDVKYHSKIPKNSFYPVPKVDGAILLFERIIPKFTDHEELLRFIKTGFSSPRKKLSSNLANVFSNKEDIELFLVKNGLTATARAAELNLEQWKNLYEYTNKKA